MMLQTLLLHSFRNYSKREFGFSDKTTLIVGPNASGKTNILEAIYCLAMGRSFRAENERELVKLGDPSFAEATEWRGSFRAEKESEVIRQSSFVTSVRGTTDSTDLEIIWDTRERSQKLYRINGVGKRQVDFVGNLRAVLFSPQDIDIVADSPSTRRQYLDSVLNLVYREYRVASRIYEKALRQRNRLLWQIRESSRFTVHSSQLEYWDNLLIENGKIVHDKRKEYLSFLSSPGDLRLDYDHSIVSQERLQRYKQEEIASAATLVGPQRDDFTVIKNSKNLHSFGSRGEQRLAVFDIKLGELVYVERIIGEKPILLLDDIFSELDHSNRHKILEVIPKQQTIMTTTDLHLVEKAAIKNFELVELG